MTVCVWAGHVRKPYVTKIHLNSLLAVISTIAVQQRSKVAIGSTTLSISALIASHTVDHKCVMTKKERGSFSKTFQPAMKSVN